jgi:hypothetical protein
MSITVAVADGSAVAARVTWFGNSKRSGKRRFDRLGASLGGCRVNRLVLANTTR